MPFWPKIAQNRSFLGGSAAHPNLGGKKAQKWPKLTQIGGPVAGPRGQKLASGVALAAASQVGVPRGPHPLGGGEDLGQILKKVGSKSFFPQIAERSRLKLCSAHRKGPQLAYGADYEALIDSSMESRGSKCAAFTFVLAFWWGTMLATVGEKGWVPQ